MRAERNSTFAYDTVRFVQEGRSPMAAANTALNLGGSLAAVGVGLTVVSLLGSRAPW